MRMHLELSDNNPRYVCDSCYNCSSVIGTSLCKIKNRGCCYYYPKFELYDIQRMSKSQEGIEVIDRIIKNPGTIIYKYYIHAKGYFDMKGYEKFLRYHNERYESIGDKSVFFRACPFVEVGKGCTIPPQYRTHVYNFFICDEITSTLRENEKFQQYIDERDRYSRWIAWENESLEYILKENHITLHDNWNETIDLLKNTPLDEYAFPEIEPIEIYEDYPRGA